MQHPFHQPHPSRAARAARTVAPLLILASSSPGQTLTRTWWQSGHAGPVNVAVASATGSRYLSAGQDGTVRLWQPTAPRQTVLPGTRGPVLAADLRADGGQAAYADFELGLCLYDVASGALVQVSDPVEGPIRELCYVSGGASVACVGDAGAVIRSGASGAVAHTLVSGAPVRAVDAGQGGLVAFGAASTVEVRDVSGGAATFAQDMAAEVHDVTLSDAGDLVAGYADGVGVTVWDVPTGAELFSIPDAAVNVRCIELTPDGAFLMVGDLAGNVHFFGARTGQFLASMTGHVGEIRCLRMIGSLPFLITASADGSSWAWALSNLQPIGPVSEVNGYGWATAASFNGSVVTTGSLRRVALRTAATGGPLTTLFPQDQSTTPWAPYGTHVLDRGVLRTVDIDPGGTWVAGGGLDGHLEVWNATTGSPSFSTALTTSFVSAVRVSMDGAKVFAATLEGGLSAWSTSTGANLWSTSSTALGDVQRIASSLDLSKVALAGDGGRVEVRDASNGQLLATIAGLDATPLDIAFSVDGSKVVVADSGGGVEVWQLGSPTPMLTHAFAGAAATAVTAMPGQDRFLAVSEQGDVVLLDLQTSTVTAVAVDHVQDEVVGIAWSAGQIVIFDRLGVASYAPAGI